MVTVTAVGEIFSAAGIAFGQLAELTSLLQEEPATTVDANGRQNDWDAEDVEALRSAVKKFGQDLASLTEKIKSKKVNAKAQSIKQKVFEDAGEPLPDATPATTGDQVADEDVSESMVTESSIGEEQTVETSEVAEETVLTSQTNIETSSIDLPADVWADDQELDFDYISLHQPFELHTTWT